MITVSYRQIPTQYYIPAFTVLLTVFSNEIIYKASDFSTVKKFGYPIAFYRNIRRYRAEALVRGYRRGYVELPRLEKVQTG